MSNAFPKSVFLNNGKPCYFLNKVKETAGLVERDTSRIQQYGHCPRDRYKSRHRSSYVIANLRLGRCQKPKNMKKTFPFQLKFNRFPTFHYVRGWLWLVPGQLFENSAALPPRLLPFLLSFSFLSCFASYLYCRNPVLLVQQVNWGLQVSFSSESCSKPFPWGVFSLKHFSLWLALPPSVFCAAPQTRARSLLLSSRLVPSSRLHRTVSSVLSPHLEIIKWVRWL